ncbi:MAG: ABC transporter permease subunit [Candidatus Lokiarchaeota archaeon]|nr:ABC transporter permease subunit [Candidatus Lokiarchaeota archaeon]
MSLWNLIKKEFDRIKTDRKSLIMLFILPLITIVIFGLSSGGGFVSFFDAAIVSYDSRIWNGTTYSEYDEILVASYYNSSLVTVKESDVFYLNSSFNESALYEIIPPEAAQLLYEGYIKTIIIVPPNFSEMVNKSNDLVLFCVYDASEMGIGDSIDTSMQEPLILFRAAIKNFHGVVLTLPYPEYDVPIWYNQILNYSAAIMIVIIVLGTSINLTSLSVVAEGPLPRMMLTPAGKTNTIIAKFISYSAVMTIQALVIFLGSMAFGLYVAGNLINILIIIILTGFSGVSIGLLISTISTSEQQANQLYIATFIFLILFSGAFIPPDSMPGGAAGLSNFLPIIHAIEMFLDVTLQGYGLDPGRVISMCVFIGVLLILSIIIFRFRKMEV